MLRKQRRLHFYTSVQFPISFFFLSFFLLLHPLPAKSSSKHILRWSEIMLVHRVGYCVHMEFTFGRLTIPIATTILFHRYMNNFHFRFALIVVVCEKEFQSKYQRCQQRHFAEHKWGAGQKCHRFHEHREHNHFGDEQTNQHWIQEFSILLLFAETIFSTACTPGTKKKEKRFNIIELLSYKSVCIKN